MKRLLLSLFLTIFDVCATDKKIVIVIPSYNNSEWYKWNLDSVFNQTYQNWRIIYTDDCSCDGTGDLVEAYIKQQGFEHKVTLIKNQVRKKALENLYTMIHDCSDDEIVAILDGDDALADPQVLEYIHQLYSTRDIWITYGQYQEWPTGAIGFCQPYQKSVIKKRAFRQVFDGPSHLRTFYAGLFKKIKKEDLMYKGAFFEMTYDLAIMFPMLEMAQYRHQFVPRVLVHYNIANQINDHKVNKKKQSDLAKFIRHKPKYTALKQLFNIQKSKR